jgi:hypothetical protein
LVKSEITTIQISKETRDILSEMGKKGETYDEIINRLIKISKAYSKES